MRSLKGSIAIAACALTLLSGAALATNLHPLISIGSGNPGQATAAPGQTGSNVLSSCGPTVGFNSIGNNAKSTTGNGSPFNPNVTKTYAGNPGNPATNPVAVSQYDNACAQAAMH